MEMALMSGSVVQHALGKYPYWQDGEDHQQGGKGGGGGEFAIGSIAPHLGGQGGGAGGGQHQRSGELADHLQHHQRQRRPQPGGNVGQDDGEEDGEGAPAQAAAGVFQVIRQQRSEERRVGKERRARSVRVRWNINERESK